MRTASLYDLGAAWSDLTHAAADWHTWGRLGWLEIKRRYRRTVIGPFWTTISLAVLVLTLGSLWAGLWGEEAQTYLPFLCSGLLVWMMISTMIIESCTTFSAAANLLSQLRFNYTLLVLALIWRNLLVFFHNSVIFILIALFTRVEVNAASLLAIPGMVLVLLNGLWISLLLGVLCLRFRDILQLVTTLMTIAIFLTPVFWMPDRLQGTRSLLVDLNPLYHLVVVVRSPLLGQVPPMTSYLAVGSMIVIGGGLAVLLYGRFRDRIPYWC